jgi:hypothetical protein
VPVSNPGIQGCISAPTNASGAPLVIHNCNTQPAVNQDWKLNFFTKENAGPEQIRIFGNKVRGFGCPVALMLIFNSQFIDVTDGVNADGTKLQI